VDGNKRIGHAAMETFLVLNGCELRASVEGAEALILEVAAGHCTREKLVEWIREHLQEL
jgi:death-on-curing protein